MQTGTVTDVSVRSLFYFTDDETGKKYIAPFSKIRGYKGERSEAPELAPGVSVSFNLDDIGRVTEVVLPKPFGKKSAGGREYVAVATMVVLAIASLISLSYIFTH